MNSLISEQTHLNRISEVKSKKLLEKLNAFRHPARLHNPSLRATSKVFFAHLYCFSFLRLLSTSALSIELLLFFFLNFKKVPFFDPSPALGLRKCFERSFCEIFFEILLRLAMRSESDLMAV